MAETRLAHRFVEFIPRELDSNTIYVSISYATAIHNCCCGCGNRVVTPLAPKEWKLIFDGRTISLEPSIGNWRYSCRSHYWITNNRVIWVVDSGGAPAMVTPKPERKSSLTAETLGGKSRTFSKPSLGNRIKNWLGIEIPPEE